MSARTDNLFKPRVVLAYTDSVHAALSCRFFRRQGWEVHLASSASETYRLVHKLAPRVIVLDTDLRDQSGWLTCAKLIAEDPDRKVILVGPEADGEKLACAAQVGASALVPRSAGAAALVGEVVGTALAAAV